LVLAMRAACSRRTLHHRQAVDGAIIGRVCWQWRLVPCRAVLPHTHMSVGRLRPSSAGPTVYTDRPTDRPTDISAIAQSYAARCAAPASTALLVHTCFFITETKSLEHTHYITMNTSVSKYGRGKS